jgi:hypothetical protein
MNLDYLMLAQRAMANQDIDWSAEPVLGSPGCYEVINELSGSSHIQRYADPAKDAFMRANVWSMMQAALQIVSESGSPDSPYAFYIPMWDLEMKLRGTLAGANSARSKQRTNTHLGLPADAHPLEPVLVQQASAQFVRNTMGALELFRQHRPLGETDTIQHLVLGSIHSLRTATQHPSEIQRSLMNIPGDAYGRRRTAQGIQPCIHEAGGAELYIAGLGKLPPNTSMCPAPDLHRITDRLHDLGYLHRYASTLGALVTWLVAVAPHTLWKEEVDLHDHHITPTTMGEFLRCYTYEYPLDIGRQDELDQAA